MQLYKYQLTKLEVIVTGTDVVEPTHKRLHHHTKTCGLNLNLIDQSLILSIIIIMKKALKM